MRKVSELTEGLAAALVEHLGVMAPILAEDIVGAIKYRAAPLVSPAELVELRVIVRMKLPQDVDADAIIRELGL
jgi:hypothetical protein